MGEKSLDTARHRCYLGAVGLNSDGKASMTTPAHPDMAWHLRRLLEAVTGAARGLEGRWGWLTGPLALMMWVLTRRERREAAEAMAAVQGLLEAFLGLLEDFRAGRLAECPTADDEANGTAGAVSHPSPQPPPSGGGGEVAASGTDGAVAPPRRRRSAPAEPVGLERGERGGPQRLPYPPDAEVAIDFPRPRRRIEATAALRYPASSAATRDSCVVARARPPPGRFSKSQMIGLEIGATISLRYRNVF